MTAKAALDAAMIRNSNPDPDMDPDFRTAFRTTPKCIAFCSVAGFNHHNNFGENWQITVRECFKSSYSNVVTCNANESRKVILDPHSQSDQQQNINASIRVTPTHDHAYQVGSTSINAFLGRRSRQRERLHATGQSICSSVCLSPKYNNAIFSKTKQFRATVSDDLQEIVHGLFKEPIIGPLKSKMAEIRHLENRHRHWRHFFLPRVVRFR